MPRAGGGHALGRQCVGERSRLTGSGEDEFGGVALRPGRTPMPGAANETEERLVSIKWLGRAIKCCGGPIFFYSGLYALLGVSFIVGSRYLDPDMKNVGLILLLVGLGILVVFVIFAFRSFRGSGRSENLD